ncbi:alpha/beta fold hydrolase [Algihabitans albus]|uniref:alpha/beta fold hydrolase n=1 Tax=Algihabitans albus TaxID=2164067 RepID=UPI0013C3785E|nr:alpha/beta fold hydrolase [Algihabitans albus]
MTDTAMTDTSPPPYEVFELADWSLDCGRVLPCARLAYRNQGRVGEGLPILTCTAFAQTPDDLSYLVGSGRPLDPARHWLIQTELLGNGRSSSPSNTPPPFDGPDFPAVTIRDNVALQARLLDHLGVARLAAVVGASMGGQQAVQWAVSHPDRVARAIVLVGSARAGLHQQLFLHSLESALTSDAAFAGGRYRTPPLEGLSRLSEAWAPWALSPAFFGLGHHLDYEDTAAEDAEGFLAKWRLRYHDRDANDLVCHLRTWQAHDIAGGTEDFASAASKARLPILFLPSATDAYFTPSQVIAEAAAFPTARVEVIESISGHGAGFGRSAADRATVFRAVSDFLNQDDHPLR